MARKKAGDQQVKVGNVTRVSGKVTIAGGNIYEGYTAEQVTFLLAEITSNYKRKPFDGRCPYKGLDVFEEEDVELFFGRERLVEDLIARVKESRTVFITGPSGSGKSSLVRAGLIPALKQGAIKNSKSWLYETMKPGREAIKELSLAFSRLKSPELATYFQEHVNEIDILNECAESVLSGRKDQRFVLFIDQFEEVFTQIKQEEERLAFIQMLAHAATVERGRVIVLFAMRSDFVSNCATYPALNELLSQEFRQIGAMQPEELVSAIALPARHVGLPVEDELIARIINDMKGEPGALPLLQFALKDLFDAQQEKGGVVALTVEDYIKHGGIHKSLERHADKIFEMLSEHEQELARLIFTSLIEIGRGTADTRRTALFDELVPANANSEEVLAVVRKLADARLVITDEQAGKDAVTLSHEKLIDAWPWLKKLVNENRDVIALQNEITNDAKEWNEHQRDTSYLYTGARLANAREQLEAKKLVLGELPREFIEAGIKAHTEELEAARQRATQLRRRSVFLSVALVVALIAVGVAVFYGVQSRQQEKIAHANEHAALAIANFQSQSARSILLSINAFHAHDSYQTRGALLEILQGSPHLRNFMFSHTIPVFSVAFSPDGKILASGGCDNSQNPGGECDHGEIILWDTTGKEPVGHLLPGPVNNVFSLAFSPDGKLLASGGSDGTIMFWNMSNKQPVGQPLKSDAPVFSIAFSPDGKTLASNGGNNSITLWDVANQKFIRSLMGHTDFIYILTFSPDGKMLASSGIDKNIILWDVSSGQSLGQPLSGHTDAVWSLAFSPNSRILASGGLDSQLILWDVESQQAMGDPLKEHTDTIFSLDFAPDGKILASGSFDKTVILWDVSQRQPIGEPLYGHSDSVDTVAFSPDGKTLVSGGFDKAVVLWNVESISPIGQLLTGHSDAVEGLAFSPDGKILASASLDSTLVLWDVKNRKLIDQLLDDKAGIAWGLDFSPDGKILASGNLVHNDIILWDVASGQPINEPLHGHTKGVLTVAFSPDGTRLASGSGDKTVILWDVSTRQAIADPLDGHTDIVTSVAFSPDGKTVASGSADHSVILWDVTTSDPIGQPLVAHTDAVTTVAFSPDGKFLASGSRDTTIILWDAASGQPNGQPLAGHSNTVTSVAFSPDGKILASGSDDSTLILWDVATRQPIGKPLKGDLSTVLNLAFSPDGKMLASGSFDKSIILWNVDPESWVATACEMVGRNFTQLEWEQYFPDEEYRIICPQWPAGK